MDPFDEFEFKPLTDGLGFHNKSVSLKEGLKNSGVLEDELQSVPPTVPGALLDEAAPANLKRHTFEDVLSALEKTPLQRKSSGTELEFTETLPRERKQATEVEPTRPVQSPFPRSEAFKTPMPGPAVNEPTLKDLKKAPASDATANVGRRGAADSPQRKLLPATMSVPSAVLDFIVVLAIAIVFLVALLSVTKVDLNAVVRNLSQDFMTQLAFGIMFIAVMQMYAVIARSFFGATLGEWTFDLQVGAADEQTSETYPLRVALRSLIVTATGLVILPVISALLRRDIAGSISGVKLYRVQM